MLISLFTKRPLVLCKINVCMLIQIALMQLVLFIITDLLKDLTSVLEYYMGNVDGASAMSGSKSGVATRIRELEPRAFYGNALNLAACDTLKKSRVMKDAIELTHEITKLIKYSLRRENIFQKVKDNLPSSVCPGIRIPCPTRWTVRAGSFECITNNFKAL